MKGKTLATLFAAAMALSQAALGDKVNVNTADADALAEGIQGVGPALAERIVAWREQNGPFQSIDQLVEVKGIGETTLERNRENLTVDPSSD